MIYIEAVLRIGMFLGPLDPDPLVRTTRYGSGSGSFYHRAKIVIKTLILIVLRLLHDEPDPNPLVRGTDPPIRTSTKTSRIRNTASKRKSACFRFIPIGLSIPTGTFCELRFKKNILELALTFLTTRV
jgi:hypothetical protein